MLAVKLERELDKREILTRYLNEVYFGRGAYGVEAAARTYFGVGVGSLQLYQAAYLAGLLRAPESADAVRRPEEATRRRNVVLEAMRDEGYISEAEEREAAAVPWNSTPNAPDGTPQSVTVQPREPERTDFGNVRYADIGSEFWVEWTRQQLRAAAGSRCRDPGPAGVHDVRPAAPGAGLRDRHRHPRPARRPGRLAGVGRREGPDPRHGRRRRLHHRQGQPGVGSPGWRERPPARVDVQAVRPGGVHRGRLLDPVAVQGAAHHAVPQRVRRARQAVAAEELRLGRPRDRDGRTGHLGLGEHGVRRHRQRGDAPAHGRHGAAPRGHGGAEPRLLTRPRLERGVGARHGLGLLDVRRRGGSHIEPYSIRRIEDSSGNVLFDAAESVNRPR